MLTLIEELREAGHEVHVFATQFPGYKDESDTVIRFPAVATKYDKGYPLPLPVSRRAVGQIASLNLDILHTQSPFLLGLLALHVSRQTGVPLIATNHTLYTEYTHYSPWFPQPWVKETCRTWVGSYYRQCDAIITPSQMAGARLHREYTVHNVPITVVPSGIPIAPTYSQCEKAAVKKQFGAEADAPMLLYVGRLAKEKNLPMLLDSCEHHIFPNSPKAVLVLAGSGVDAASIQERVDASPNLKGRVTLTGFIDRSALDPIYAAADLFVFPSCTETQGMVLGEALAAGTPCVVVNEGGAPETVADGIDGIRVPDDPKEFACAVLKVLGDDQLRARMGAAGLELAADRTPVCMARRIQDVYAEAVVHAASRVHRAPTRLESARVQIENSRLAALFRR